MILARRSEKWRKERKEGKRGENDFFGFWPKKKERIDQVVKDLKGSSRKQEKCKVGLTIWETNLTFVF